MRRMAGWVLLLLLILGVGAGAGWALAHVTRDSDPGQAAAPPVTALVTSGTISAETAIEATAAWPSRPLATNRRVGVVTTVNVSTGDRVGPGDVLYAVNLVPVVVAEGTLPLFRDIGSGTRGPDVAQVQRLLAGAGFYSGPADGVAGVGTVAAIRAWQKDLGAPVTGVIRPGEVLMVPSLPVRVLVDAKVLRVGAELTGGEGVVRAFAAHPTFRVRTTDQVAALLAPEAAVTIDRGDGGGAWAALPGKQSVDSETGETLVALTGVADAPVCGKSCTSVPYAGTTSYRATAVTMPPVTGSLIPAAAVATDAVGGSVVVLADGQQRAVSVLGAARGQACVTGVEPGQRVRIPAGIG